MKLSVSRSFLFRKLGLLLLTVWISATLIFIIPRLAPGDPISAMIARMSQQSGYVENADKIILPGVGSYDSAILKLKEKNWLNLFRLLPVEILSLIHISEPTRPY